MSFNGAITTFFEGSGVLVSPEPSQDEGKRLRKGLAGFLAVPVVDNEVVHDGAVTEIDYCTFAGLTDFMRQGLCVAMASLQVLLSGWGWESLHGIPFKQAIAPETAHENEQLLELSE